MKLWHPEHRPEGVLWTAPEVQEIVRRIQHGYPELGWEGDPRLAVYWNRETERWEIWRLCEDGEYRMILRSAPRTRLDERVIHVLLQHDAWRGYDPKVAVDRHNARVDREKERIASERNEDLADKLAHALKKDGVE
jgi:hypothetical protein